MNRSDQTTLSYYETTAEKYAQETLPVSMKYAYDRFLFYLPKTGRLLDLGCGSGRDTRFFLEKGFQVDAADGCEAMVRIASETCGIPVRKMLFEELDADSAYEGIWACASLLHCQKNELGSILAKMLKAVKKEGVIYMSFKLGDFEGFRGSRYYTDLDVAGLYGILKDFENCLLLECWKSHDQRTGRFDEMWLNAIVRRTA